MTGVVCEMFGILLDALVRAVFARSEHVIWTRASMGDDGDDW